jgi:hypothetical protein
MKYSFFLRFITASIGFLIVSVAFALPPAPPGPYQSIEDTLIEAEGTSQPSVRDQQPTAREIARERAISEQARDGSQGMPSIRNMREVDPALMRQGNGYPPAGDSSGYRYYPKVAPR